MGSNDGAISEIADEILILGLVVILSAVIFATVFGLLPLIPKGAYLAADISLQKMPGYSAINIFHRGGDPLKLLPTGDAAYPAEIFVFSQGGSYKVIPDTNAATFKPGSRFYIYYTGTGYRLTSDLASMTPLPLPSENVRVTIVDTSSGLLIKEWNSMATGTTTTVTAAPTSTVTPTPTATPNATVTTVVTTGTPTPTATATPNATVTTVVTTATPTATATTSSGTLNIGVSWSPNGLGAISVSPPTPLSNPGTVAVISGSSQTFSFIPRSNKAVESVTLDGTTIYTGSSTNVTVTYTITNVVAPHTLAATFG